MNNDTLNNYKVRHHGGREITVQAKNHTEAKRQACKFWGYKPNDYWLGITACSANLISTGKVG